MKADNTSREDLCRRFEPGMRVRYVPGHAHGNSTHPDCEDGRVSSQNGHSVFIKLDKTVKRLGWSGTTSQSCDPSDLVPVP
jgi:hypothetical protein